MTTHNIDILISGAGIAGLWLFHRLRRAGYAVMLLEGNSIGCGQTVASQGIIHSGLKYAFAGQINAFARSISAMPDLWRAALRGEGPVDLSAARVQANSQYLLIPSGFMGGLIGLVTQRALGNNVHKLNRDEWPDPIAATGFDGTVVFMDEPVLDIPSALHALAAPHQDSIRKADILNDVTWEQDSGGNITAAHIGDTRIVARQYIFTAAGANHQMAKRLGHAAGLNTQKRPLLMGMMRGAPGELYAHCVGPSDKPVMTVTTHRHRDGDLVWYLGGAVAERDKEANPADVYKAAHAALEKYMPSVDLSRVQWSTLPVDRVEGKSATRGHLPDTPTIHTAHNALYCWPTKLTFAPMLSDQIVDHLNKHRIEPSGDMEGSFADLPPCPITATPWDEAEWTDAN